MGLDVSRYKAYAGGVGGAGTFMAGQTLLDKLTIILTWLLSFLGSPPEIVAQAIAFVVVAVGSYAIGYLITYFAPPNQIPGHSPEAYIEAIKEAGKRE